MGKKKTIHNDYEYPSNNKHMYDILIFFRFNLIDIYDVQSKLEKYLNQTNSNS